MEAPVGLLGAGIVAGTIGEQEVGSFFSVPFLLEITGCCAEGFMFVKLTLGDFVDDSDACVGVSFFSPLYVLSFLDFLDLASGVTGPLSSSS